MFLCQPVIPYEFVNGSLNNGMAGGAKVKMINAAPIKHMIPNESFELKDSVLLPLNSRVSVRKAAAVEIKNIVIFSQSGDSPKAPLLV